MPRHSYQRVKKSKPLRENKNGESVPTRIDLLKEIESIAPDHDQRKLAIEVNIQN